MKKETYTNKLNELVMNYKELKDEFVKSDISGTTWGNQHWCYIQLSYNTIDDDNYYYITVNDCLSDYQYTLTFKNGDMLMAQRTYYKYGYKEITETVTINTFDKHFRNALKEIERNIKSKKREIKIDKMLNDNNLNKTVAEKAAVMDNTISVENDTVKDMDNSTVKDMDNSTVKDMDNIAEYMADTDKYEFIADLLDTYDISKYCYFTADIIEAITDYGEFDMDNINGFINKIKKVPESHLTADIIEWNLDAFYLDFLINGEFYHYESPEDYIDNFLECFNSDVREFYDKYMYYLIDTREFYDYLTGYEGNFIETESGEIIELMNY